MRLVLAATLLITTSTAMADFSELTDEDINFCSDIQDMAIEVMKDWQSGVPLMDAIKVAKQEEGYWQEARLKLVEEIYEMPVFTSEIMGVDMIALFGNSVAKACLENALEEKEKAAFEGALLDEEARVKAELQQYFMQIDRAVENNWLRPATTSEEQSCEVIVTQTMSGDVIDVQLQSCSSDKAFQRSVERAVRKASPLPLPPDPELFDRKIQFTFKH